MNKKIILGIILMLVFSSITLDKAFGQLKVKGETGKVIVGQDRNDDALEDFEQILSASIFGKEGFFKSGSKIAFGDFGRFDHWGWNVFVGEYGLLDSDQLWLHGKNGFYITYGRGESNYNLLSFDINKSKSLFINSEVIANGLKIPTDVDIQEDVQEIHNSFSRINELQGITYKYRPYYLNSSRRTTSLTTETLNDTLVSKYIQTKSLSLTFETSEEKEDHDDSFFSNLNTEIEGYAPQKNGFNPEQIRDLFPELLETDSNGNTYVDYIGLIPVLVEALKEQSNILAAQSLMIKELESSSNIELLNTISTDSISQKKNQIISSDTNAYNSLANAFLYQNTPNPFNTTTEIKYFLPEGSTNSYIYVFDMQGALLLSNPISGKGFGSVIINGTQLQAGMYIYSLVINGNQVSTKRMILTK